MTKIASLLQSERKDFRVTSSSRTNLSHLREGPIVLIGPHNNHWTMRVLQDLRFFMQLDVSGDYILDRQNASNKEWPLSPQLQYAKFSNDFGLIARLHDDTTTGRPLIIAAGLSSQVTLAAGEFITKPEYLQSFLKSAPANWPKMNIEAIVQAQVIDGKPGPPRVVAVQYR